MKRRFTLLGFLTLLFLIIGMTACSNDESTDEDSAPNSDLGDKLEPVTIGIRVQGKFTDKEVFEEYYVKPLAEVYPHITLKPMETDLSLMEDNILNKNVPDIYAGWNGNLTQIIELELAQDVRPYMEAIGSDLNRFVPETLDSIMVDGELYGIPYAQQFNALYYNKDVFDLFGINYPKDGMTWDDAIELGRKVTGERNGVAYQGLNPGAFWRLLNPLGLGSLIEYGTNKNLVPERRDDLVTVFETAEKIYSIVGNAPEDIEGINVEVSEFAEGKVAMLATVNRISSFPDVNWGVAQYPSYEQVPDTFGAADVHYHFLLSTSKHPEDAVRVMDFFSSPESQERLASQLSQYPVMKDIEVVSKFAEEDPSTEGIDLSGIFKSHPAKSPILHESMASVREMLGVKAVQMVNGEKDINTILSEIEQEVDILIEDYKGSK